MNIKTVASVVALAFSTAVLAAAPAAPAPKEECCCCKKGADGKMACCDKGEKAGHHSDGHDGHNMNEMKGS